MLLTFIHSVNITRVWSRGWNASKQQNRQLSKSLYSTEGTKRNTISKAHSMPDDVTRASDGVTQGNKAAKESVSGVYGGGVATHRGGLIARTDRRGREDGTAGWPHRLDGHEPEQAPGVGDAQGSLAWGSPRGRKESDTTE